MKTLKILSIASALALSSGVNAAPVTITVNGTVSSSWGSMDEQANNTVTATFMFDLDGTAATNIDNDDSNNPLETFSAIYAFGDGSYSWSAYSSIDPNAVGSSYVSVRTMDNYSDPVITGGQSVDVIDIWGSAVSSICPQEILDTKGYCDYTDTNPGSGIEAGLFMATADNWFTGDALPSYIPGLADLLAAGIWASEYSGGLEIGGFEATVDSMSVSAVPVPAAVWLFASGMVGLAGIARRNRT